MRVKTLLIALPFLALAFGLGYYTGQSSEFNQPAPDLPSAHPKNNAGTTPSYEHKLHQEAVGASQQVNLSVAKPVVTMEADNAEFSKQHTLQQKQFVNSDKHDQKSWQLQQHLQDYFLLYTQPEKIELLQVMCDGSQCQFIGNFAGSPKEWTDILYQMEQQDWWDFTNTSNHAQSKNNQLTSFVVFTTR